MRLLIALSTALLLASCAGNSLKSEVAALEVTLTAADQTALAYINLPLCAPGAPPLCHTTAMKTQIAKFAPLAYTAVKGAQKVAADASAAPSTIAAAIAAASDTLSIFTSITAQLKVN